MAELLTNTTDLTKVASAIREKGGTSDPLVYPDGFVAAIGNIQTGGGTTPGAPGDITFYDYDGTIVTSWTLEELATKTALPDYPSHEGLICQGWNWSLADLKTTNRKMNVGAMYITDDGKTRIYIRLEEGRTSPMLGVCPNGTVTVDWGDGTTPDTLTGTSTSTVKWTPNHAYAAPGEYVIKLTVDGAMGFYASSSNGELSAILRYSSGADDRNRVYRNSVMRVEIGSGIQSISKFAFMSCFSLVSITIPNGVTSIGNAAFNACYALASITIPNGVTSIGNTVFYNCYTLASIAIPNGVTSIGGSPFNNCYALASITIPNGVTSIGGTMCANCTRLASITIPGSVTNIGQSAFTNNYALKSITIADGVSSLAMGMFGSCYSVALIVVPNSVASIGGSAFSNCSGVSLYDFTAAASVPALSTSSVFSGIPEDCQIRVPASLVDEWKAATNWSTYADHIVGV